MGAVYKRWPVLVLLCLAPSLACPQEKSAEAPAAPKKKPAAAVSQPTEKSDVALNGQLVRETAGPGDVIRFWITLENKTDAPLTNIWLEHLDLPGFTLVRRCWSDARNDPSCYAQSEPAPPLAPFCTGNGQSALPPDELCELLPAKQTLTVWGDVRFSHPAPRNGDFAVIRWSSEKHTSRAVVALGPLESYSRVRSIWEAITTDWQIGIPVWITILSGLYAAWKSWREAQAHKRATEFEQRRRTWNLLLLKVHRLAFQHYMPIVSTVQGALMYLERLRINEGDRQENILGAFCYVLRFHWRIRKMKRSGASWYFKDLTAEELVVTLVQTHRRSLGLSDLRRQAALDEFLEDITEETTVARMLDYLEHTSERQAAFWKEFQGWIERAQQREEAALLSALTKIITYETNRPYFYWYEELRPMALNAAELRTIREAAQAQEGSQPGFAARVESYLQDVSHYKGLKNGRT